MFTVCLKFLELFSLFIFVLFKLPRKAKKELFCYTYKRTFLLQVREEWSSGSFVIKPGDEDIHTANERRLKVK